MNSYILAINESENLEELRDVVKKKHLDILNPLETTSEDFEDHEDQFLLAIQPKEKLRNKETVAELSRQVSILNEIVMELSNGEIDPSKIRDDLKLRRRVIRENKTSSAEELAGKFGKGKLRQIASSFFIKTTEESSKSEMSSAIKAKITKIDERKKSRNKDEEEPEKEPSEKPEKGPIKAPKLNEVKSRKKKKN